MVQEMMEGCVGADLCFLLDDAYSPDVSIMSHKLFIAPLSFSPRSQSLLQNWQVVAFTFIPPPQVEN